MKSKRQLRQGLSRYQRKPHPIPGILGDFAGTVKVPLRPNFVYVRLAGNHLTEVYNVRVPAVYDLPVYVGYDPDEPKLQQVLNIRSFQSRSGTGTSPVYSVQQHHQQHEWPQGKDIVFSSLRQFTPFRPTPRDGMRLNVYRGISQINQQWVYFSGSTVDLSWAVPFTGSAFAQIYVGADGALGIATGTIKALNTISPTDIPAPIPGTLPIAAVRLWGGQTGISEAQTDTDLVDLRWWWPPNQNLYASGTVFFNGLGATHGQVFAYSTGTNPPSWIPSVVGAGSSTGSSVALLDEGVAKGDVSGFDFVGPNVWASKSGAVGIITISGTSSPSSFTGSAIVLLDEGTPQGDISGINFVGQNVWASRSGAVGTVIISGSSSSASTGSSIDLLDEGVSQGDISGIDFRGPNVWASRQGARGVVVISGSASGGVTGGSITLLDEGVSQGNVSALNFIGENTWASNSGGTGDVIFSGSAYFPMMGMRDIAPSFRWSSRFDINLNSYPYLSGITWAPSLWAFASGTASYMQFIVGGYDWQGNVRLSYWYMNSAIDRFSVSGDLATSPTGSLVYGKHSHQDTMSAGQLDHGLALLGLGDDDHPQYLTTGRHNTSLHGASVVDHGSIGGLGDDDHPQYLTNARHDTTARHTLGTVVPHDTHALLGGLGADDHTQYLLADGSRHLGGSLIPALTDTYDLGSTSRLWRKGYISELDAIDINGNLINVLGGLNVGGVTGAGAGDIQYTGALKSYKNSTAYTGYIRVPVIPPKTIVNGAALALGANNYLLTSFGLPAGIKTVDVRLLGKWAAAADASSVTLRDTSSNDGIAVRAQVANIHSENNGTAPIGSDGVLRAWVSGAATTSTFIIITGYYI